MESTPPGGLATAAADSETAVPPVNHIAQIDAYLVALTEYAAACQSVPNGSDYAFNTAFRSFNRAMARHSAAMLGLMDQATAMHIPAKRRVSIVAPNTALGANARPAAPSSSSSASASASALSSTRAAVICDTIDELLENADHLLDELKGEKLVADAQADMSFASDGVDGSQPGALATTTDFSGSKALRMIRPQQFFSVKPDNTATPFRARVVVASALPISTPDVDGSDRPPLGGGGGVPETSTIPTVGDTATSLLCDPGVHPFRGHISRFAFQSSQLRAPTHDQPFLPLRSTPLSVIDTPVAFHALLNRLLAMAKQNHLPVGDAPMTGGNDHAGLPELAIDLEHHNFHSFQGFTCLIQLSTRHEDAILDPIRLRDEMHWLNLLTLDPTIVKVLHSASEDIRWLQKDFGVYVCNLFDTAIALQTLHLPFSLKFLVDHFCQVSLDKTLQNTDWRRRPLTADMIEYARQDTHYLLYCYDRLRCRLLEAAASTGSASHAAGHGVSFALGNPLLHVLSESRRLCLTMYDKPVHNDQTSYEDGLSRSLSGLSAEQREVARRVYNWRDRTARQHDESPPAIMTTASVMNVATRLPLTVVDVIRCAHPVTVFVRSAAAEILQMVVDVVGAFDDPSQRPQTTAAATSTPLGSTATTPGFLRTHSSGARRYLPMSGMLPPLTLPAMAHAAGGGPPCGAAVGCVATLSAAADSVTRSSSAWRAAVLLWPLQTEAGQQRRIQLRASLPGAAFLEGALRRKRGGADHRHGRDAPPSGDVVLAAASLPVDGPSHHRQHEEDVDGLGEVVQFSADLHAVGVPEGEQENGPSNPSTSVGNAESDATHGVVYKSAVEEFGGLGRSDRRKRRREGGAES